MLIKKISQIGLFLCATNVYASNVPVEDGNWTKTFTLANKMVVVHTPEKVQVNIGGLNMTVGEYSFSANSSMNGIKPSADGKLSKAMSLATFREELKKFGAIASEK